MFMFLTLSTFSALERSAKNIARWLAIVGLLAGAPLLQAQSVEAPDALIQRVAGELVEAANKDPGWGRDNTRIQALVASKIMPNVNFLRMTAASVGPSWRSASSEQRKRLIESFKVLLLRTYSGAFKELRGLSVNVKPLRTLSEDASEVLVRTEVRGRGEPIQLDYRLEKAKTPDAVSPVWRIYDVNVMGVWLVETYRGQFAAEINANGIDGLIRSLQDKSKVAQK